MHTRVIIFEIQGKDKHRLAALRCYNTFVASAFCFGTLTHKEEDFMTAKKATVLNILISLLFAAAIVISSALVADTETAETMTYILIALWFIPFAYLTGRGVKSSSQ